MRALGSTLLLAALVACADATIIPVNRCDTAEDCQGDRICLDYTCVDPSAGKVSGLDVEIAPPDGTPFAKTQLRGVTFDPDKGPTPLLLPEAVVYSRITLLNTAGQPIPARITFLGTDRIPTHEVDAVVETTSDRPGSARLLPGKYEVRVLPSDPQIPGVHVRDWEVRGGLPAGQHRSFQVPSSYRRLRGEVRLRTSAVTKVPGVTVAARAVSSGLPSTRAVTGLDGRFELMLPDTRDNVFEISATPLDPAGAAWSFLTEVALIDETEFVIGLEQSSDAVRGQLRLRVMGRGQAGPEPVPHAHVTLTASTSVPYRSFRLEGATDEDGFFRPPASATSTSAMILASSYIVRVEPDSSSAFQGEEVVLNLPAQATTLLDKQIELRPKVRVRGTLRSPLGQLVGGATLRFESTEDHARTVNAATNQEGVFEVALPGGDYFVVVSPVSNSKLSEILPVSTTSLFVPDVPDGVAVLEILPITLERGTLVTGQVFGGGLLEGAHVELIRTIDGRAISLGRADSDPFGEVQFVLPLDRPALP